MFSFSKTYDHASPVRAEPSSITLTHHDTTSRLVADFCRNFLVAVAVRLNCQFQQPLRFQIKADGDDELLIAESCFIFSPSFSVLKPHL